MSKTQPSEVKTDAKAITGPHIAQDVTGATYEYYRYEACGVETTDPSIRSGCFRCGGDGQ